MKIDTGNITKGTIFYFMILGVILPVALVLTGRLPLDQISVKFELFLAFISFLWTLLMLYWPSRNPQTGIV